MARSTKSKLKSKWSDKQLSLLDLIQRKEEIKDNIRVMLKFSHSPETWRGLVATPPGSFLEKVIFAFQKASDIPLEIPFFSVLHIISAELLHRGITINFVGQQLKPDLWTIILAESGSGKTFSISELKRSLNINPNIFFPQVTTAARFIAELSDHNNTLWIRDEILQLLKGINTQTYLMELKDILLQVYDGDTISRRTKKEEIVVEKPALTILGLNVYSTFIREIDAESLLDGFAQRFSYVVGNSDPKRPSVNFPIYDFRPFRKQLKKAWDDLVLNLPEENSIYEVSDDAIEAFKTAFESLMPTQDEGIPMSFYRRIMFRGIRYALLYHILLRKSDKIIDHQDMGWAGRLVGLHIKDASKILFDSGGDGTTSKLFVVLQKAEKLRDKILKEENRKITARDLIRGIWDIENAVQAKAILSML